VRLARTARRQHVHAQLPLPLRRNGAVVAASAGDGTIAFRKSNREAPRDAGHRYGDQAHARPRVVLAATASVC
jgi:hypothetical protein